MDRECYESASEIKEVCTNLRAPKIAIFIFQNDDWEKNCFEIIESMSMVWGGAKNLLIPTDGKTIDKKFWILLEHFDPDYLYSCDFRDDYREISEELQKDILKRLNPFFNRDLSKNPVDPNFNPSYPLTILTDIISNTKFEKNIIYSPKFDSKFSNCPDHVKLMIYSVLGKLSDNHGKKLKELGIDIVETGFYDNFHKVFNNAKNFQNNLDYYPFYYSMVNLDQYYDKSFRKKVRNSDPIVVMGNSLDDFCFYYNLKNLRNDVFWIPISILENSKSMNPVPMQDSFNTHLTSLILRFLSRLANPLDFKHQNIILTSISKRNNELEKIRDGLISQSSSFSDSFCISKNLNDLLPYFFKLYEHENTNNCSREQFIGFKSINRINTPIPRNFNHRSFENHYWITEVNIERYKLPAYYVLSDVLEAHLYKNREIRVSKNGLAYFCPNIFYMGDSIDKYVIKPYINLLKPFDIAEKIFEEYGFIILTSDKGNYERETIERFGSLDKTLKFFKNNKYQNLFNHFMLKKNPKTPEKGIFLNDDKRIYLTLSVFKELLKDEMNIIVNDFIEKDILHRGFIFKCEKCKYTGWYDIEDVNTKFKCRRCGTTQYYNSKHLVRQNSVEPEWFYKLDETIYQGYDNDMIVPILTLGRIKEESKSFHYINEIEIREKKFPKVQYMEIDICCISDGDFVIGECKKENSLSEADIKKYKYLYNKIGAHKLIFSTFHENGWSENTKKRLKELLDEKINYKLFDKNDLLG
ncbi:hypothetical protein MBCUT_04420 [Methanobrevibacter cuticularis]|uniref:Uncharacterized protein n=1 Tax=Methanobrevibacter cuticularis TaxID=47311 RepID=A0A166EQA2_9EURY|nr:hypothetical protein [Methanobrevibacter cuticularis]KZX16894.1 hypothetical protein MBCUT_04420 [Methanobrevibacter cuticularis]